MKTATKKLTLNKLCWTILGRWEQVQQKSKQEAEQIERTYQSTMMMVRLTTANMVTPKTDMRNRLEDLNNVLARTIRQLNEEKPMIDYHKGATEAIEMAYKHLGTGHMIGSAKVALDDAEGCFADQEFLCSYIRAMKSLCYSVGILHPDYERLWKLYR